MDQMLQSTECGHHFAAAVFVVTMTLMDAYMMVLSIQCLQYSIVTNVQGHWPIAECQLFYQLLAVYCPLSMNQTDDTLIVLHTHHTLVCSVSC